MGKDVHHEALLAIADAPVPMLVSHVKVHLSVRLSFSISVVLHISVVATSPTLLPPFVEGLLRGAHSVFGGGGLTVSERIRCNADDAM